MTPPTIQNSQRRIARIFWGCGLFFAVVVFSPLVFRPVVDSVPCISHPAVTFLSIFFSLSTLAIACIFNKRAKKMDALLSGKKLLACWRLDKETLVKYSICQRKEKQAKNRLLLIIVTFFFVGITLLVVFFLDADDRPGYLLFNGSILLFIALFAFGFPWYFQFKNLRGDGHILVGAKYAYINGYFHNWDFLLSGIKSVVAIKEPFYGIALTYYYTDKTGRHTHTLTLPAPEELDIKKLARKIIEGDKKQEYST